MKSPDRRHPDDRTIPPFKSRWQRWRARLALFHVRDYWWRLLDFFEASRSRRKALYAGLVLVAAGLAAATWVYPWWARRNAIRIARQWLEAGQLHNAAEAAQRAAQLAPDRPEPWLIAAELARLGGQHPDALRYYRRAMDLAPEDSAITIGWAAAALRAGELREASTALNRLPPAEVAASADAQRIRGEIARQRLRLTDARGFFEAAQKLEGARAVNEVPLGLVLLQSTDPALRQRGLDLLVKWSTDGNWGVTAQRTLLADATNRDDRPAMRRWAEALWANPVRTIGDMPDCLRAFSRTDEVRFAAVLAGLERDHAVTPQAATQLLSWLNEIGRGEEAVRWMRTLPADAMHRPPLVVAGADALRISGDWGALADWTATGNWGAEVEFLRWTYGLQAAHMLGNDERAGELLRTLAGHARLNGVHGLFAASSLYGWGRKDEGIELWWIVAEQENKLAVDALGSLARHYQVERDADGQYRVFRRLHSLRPQDPGISNNFAFFALLTNREQRIAATLAREVAEQNPRNKNYFATHLFALVQQGRADDAVALAQPRAAEAATAPGLAFAYGLALSNVGRKDEARTLLQRLPPNSLTTAESDLIRTSLAN